MYLQDIIKCEVPYQNQTFAARYTFEKMSKSNLQDQNCVL